MLILSFLAISLNLTAASRIFIFEPQWNPSVERQAIARAIRIGQDNQVSVMRYVIKGTVEEVSETLFPRSKTVKDWLLNHQNRKSAPNRSKSGALP